MEKIAICIPSYNEKNNIKNITVLIDKALKLLDSKYDSLIVNCDNNSPDETNLIFNKTKTIHPKESIISKKCGKGRNLYNFFQFCLNNNITYAITIDADLKSFKNDWLVKMIKKLEQGNDFVCPLYKRRKEEGNTTNHFVCPILYATYGVFLRQPIGGDYAFNQKFIQTILKEKFSNNILQYGIDIFMIATAINKNLKITEVNLGEKEHNISYPKMLDIFEGVVKGFNETYKHYPQKLKKQTINYSIYPISNPKWPYFTNFKKIYIDYLENINYYNYEKMRNEWLNILKLYLDSIPNVSEALILKMKKAFIQYCVSFWKYVDRNHNSLWEKIIIDNCLELGGNSEIKN